MQLRPYQEDAKLDIYNAWASPGIENVLGVMPTGAGKTVLFAKIVADNAGPVCVVAHRQELVGQISLALAQNQIRHRIIGPKNVVKTIVRLHMEELGHSYYDPSAPTGVAGVDTIMSRKGTGADGDYYLRKVKVYPDEDQLFEYGPRTRGMWGEPRLVNKIRPYSLSGSSKPKNADTAFVNWCLSITLWVMDEAHHVLKTNKWGKAVEMFPNARGLGVTATPCRADGHGLGRHADGLFDCMVGHELTMRDLINAGYLTDYKVYGPPSDFDVDSIPLTASGEFSGPKMIVAAKKSHITGDVVKHYLKLAPGKLGITFATDVDTATKTAEKFNETGIPAAVVSAKTPDRERTSLLRKFRNRELLQLVNVDLFGEGFDLPAIEVVSMARPTQSFALFVQQGGRGLRIMDGKQKAILIDHVGNFERHATVVDRGGALKIEICHREWTLDRREKKSKGADDTIPVRACPECAAVYERIYPACPDCGYHPEPAARSAPEYVDGDLMELDAATLAAMWGEVDKIDMPAEDYRAELVQKNVPLIGQRGNVNRHIRNQEGQAALRASIAWWAGFQRAAGRTDTESYRRFYFAFNIDVMTAQTLRRDDALTLADKINYKLTIDAMDN